MELEGLKRGLAVFKDHDINVKELVTDRHPQVKKYMREENADISHYFDVWHMAKGTYRDNSQLNCSSNFNIFRLFNAFPSFKD